MKDQQFKQLIEQFKKETVEVELNITSFYEKEFGDFIISFEYDVWQSELSKVVFSEIDLMEVYDNELDEEIELTEIQLQLLNEVAKQLVEVEYEEYEHPSEHSFSYGGL